VDDLHQQAVARLDGMLIEVARVGKVLARRLFARDRLSPVS
jgi:hypothetical protein